jgi:fatty acyl-CoA reductase
MGEMVINALRGDIPVVTMRPSIIESTLKDPFPGWIQGNRLVSKIVINLMQVFTSIYVFDDHAPP